MFFRPDYVLLPAIPLGANYNKCCQGKYGPGTGTIIKGLSCTYDDKTVLDCEFAIAKSMTMSVPILPMLVFAA